jgi:hypothetical protein
VHYRFHRQPRQGIAGADINGYVRFFGGNLKATYDFAKKAATLTRQNFSATEGA